MRTTLNLALSLLLLTSFSAEAQILIWRQTDHPSEHSVSNLLLLNEVVYSGTSGGEIYRSVDNGNNWELISEEFLPSGVVEMIEGPEDEIFVTTRNKGVFFSYDEGRTWLPDTVGLTNLSTTAITYDSEYFYTATNDGVYRRALRGKLWIKLSTPIKGMSTHVHSLASTPIGLFAGGVGVLLYSPDWGERWFSYPSDSRTNVISLLWRDGQLLIGTSGEGVFNLMEPESEWTTREELLGGTTRGVVHRLMGIDAGIITLTNQIGLVLGGDILTRDLQDNHITDFLKLETNDLVSTENDGVYTTARLLGFRSDDMPVTESSPNIFPTVTKDEINIEMLLPDGLEGLAEVLDGSGRRIYSLRMMPGGSRWTLSLSHLSSGTYWLRTKVEDQVHTQLIVLTK